ncbi:uncharacterized protein PAC_04282 [Phialocephala subalpina]|uniref:DUF7580 domain-containing protein n=1 Tax=Phialocephala subalpina TaxID=576137 RepID=A0A1L7WNQ3_9HELO|nr:uncharacterized protein PAC_04282 [Phialocephala subalpina]
MAEIAHSTLCQQLQLYSGSWLNEEWTKKIGFLTPKDDHIPQSLSSPFLTAQRATSPQGQSEDDGLLDHLDPYILSLGILPLELELGAPIDTIYSAEDVSRNPNLFLARARQLLSDLQKGKDVKKGSTMAAKRHLREICASKAFIHLTLLTHLGIRVSDDRLNDLEARVHPLFLNPPKVPIKIAILDSGIDLPGKGILGAFRKRATSSYHSTHLSLKPVIIFAAAANHGNRHGIVWPASADQVICMHATDGNGNTSFTPDAKAGKSFATLGRPVPSYWPLSLQDKGKELVVKERSREMAHPLPLQ